MSLQHQPQLQISIQGFPGSFHDLATRQFFQNYPVRIIPCSSFKEVFDRVKKNEAGLAVVAIENSLAGSLLPNYSLLKNSGLHIAGEIYLRIEQNLMALPSQTLDDIKEVHSHPMAIIQCEEFLEPLRERGVKIVDSVDTAISAQWIAENQLKGIAALASDLAAEMHGLEILARSVETNKKNFTRFLALAQAQEAKRFISTKTNKASISFTLPHKTGSLSQVLSVLAFYNINLTKIQSAPIIGKDWEYFFYVDLVYDNRDMYLKALDAIKPLVDQVYVMGEYVSALLAT